MMPKIHRLKILPEYFEAICRNEKQFELRKDDREYNVGDFIDLQEYENGHYTGRELRRIPIRYILRDVPEYGLKAGYCIIGFQGGLKAGKLEFQDLLTELKRSCNCAFLCDMPAEKDILNAAAQIYVEQIHIEAEKERVCDVNLQHVDEQINKVIDAIDAAITRYEGDIGFTDYSDVKCRHCNDILFQSIHNIINNHRRSNNE